MSKIRNSGTLLVFLGAVFWSLNAPLVKFLTADSLLICGLRSIIAGITLMPFIRWKRLNWTPWMAVYISSYCALCISIIIALSKTSAAIAVGMQYTATIWLFLANFVITRKFNKKAFWPVCVIFAGVVFFMCSGTDKSSSSGNTIALLEGIFFACMSVGAKKSAGTNPIGLTAIANLFTGIFVFVAFPSTAGYIGTLALTDWIVLLILGIIQIGAGYAFYNLGIQMISAQKASVIALWEMILGPVWVALFLKEYPSPIVLAGFVIILAGMLLDTKINVPDARETVL
ncbi:DMT family transporter [[Clostridium] symbiosum]|uniref:DMT family transporter n=1 Tax=Clostridium symbiosum TaxID=1512 RepID=UPI001D06D494|nr:DMT family transporter [[Clostridium] symbiosum]MCB6609569.1 DMT family transporter [[Clostridium] symbiosum]MCB6931513.1 DMT family transporter [[Clostridium] symbiosum]